MKWIVRIEGENEKKERIKVVFDPMAEKVHFYGEYRADNRSGNNKDGWVVFSEFIHEMEIDLDEMKVMMENCLVQMRKRANEYENLNKGFSVLKWVGFEED
jgi:hypothetical protein